LRAHLEVAGLGQISEIADAEPPYRPGGCPFQAWSLGEFLRVRRLLADPQKIVPAACVA
jgi:glycogen debranching enzyme